MDVGNWAQHQAEFLRTLTGRTVAAWAGVEMAVREAGPDGHPQWYDETVPALQLDRLDLLLADGPATSIITYENDAGWGLCRCDDLPPSKLPTGEPDCIFRARGLDELPPGEITAVELELHENGDIAAVRMSVGGRDVELRAGEVYEREDGTLRVDMMDECVLVQVDGRMPNQALQPTPAQGGGGG